jgi:hypothetical protein
VTEAIGIFTREAFANIPPDTLAAAQDRGNAFHEFAAAYAAKLWIPEVPETIFGFCVSFTKWFDKFVVETLAVEQRLHHPTLYYEGTPDWIGVVKGDTGLTLIDWKTPLFASKSWRLQLAAYKMLAEKNGFAIARVASLQPRRDGKPAKFIDYPRSLTRDMAFFMRVLDVWRYFDAD